jgi:hypothetical protein
MAIAIATTPDVVRSCLGIVKPSREAPTVGRVIGGVNGSQIAIQAFSTVSHPSAAICFNAIISMDC